MHPSPPLSTNAIRNGMTTRSIGRRIELYERIGSTNRAAMALAQAGAEHGTVVLADSQTDGRGRLARQWFSPPGVNVYCSIIIRTSVDGERLSGWLSWLPLITSLAAAEAIEKVAATRVLVKWPNDLLIAERKAGGILCESGTGVTGPFQIIGLGLNVNGRRLDFASELRDIAATIYDETGRPTDRNQLLAVFFKECEECLEELASRGFERIGLAYQQRSATIGKIVKAVLADGTEFVGLANNIGSDGSLTVIQRPAPPDGRPPEIRQLRAADIVHLRN